MLKSIDDRSLVDNNFWRESEFRASERELYELSEKYLSLFNEHKMAISTLDEMIQYTNKLADVVRELREENAAVVLVDSELRKVSVRLERVTDAYFRLEQRLSEEESRGHVGR